MSDIERIFQKRPAITNLFERSLEVSKIKHYRSLLIDAGDNQTEHRVNEKLHDLIKISRNRILTFDTQM